MDGFTYHNIFETKGIEYILIITFFLVLIPFWMLLNRRSKRLSRIRELAALSAETLQIPKGVHFFKNHTWMHLAKNGLAKIGLDDLLVHITGAVQVKLLTEPGSVVKKGDVLAEVHQDGKRLKILSPVTGEIQRVNHNLEKEPEKINLDPFNQGWMYEVKPNQWIGESQSSLIAEDAVLWLKGELSRFREFLLQSVGAQNKQAPGMVLQDGGELRDHTLSRMPKETWDNFEKDFLSLDE